MHLQGHQREGFQAVVLASIYGAFCGPFVSRKEAVGTNSHLFVELGYARDLIS